VTQVRYLLESLSFLDWWALAALLALADVLVPRTRLLAPAAAAGVVGFTLLLFPQLEWPWQLVGFGLLTAAGLIAYLVRRRRVTPNGPGAIPMGDFYDFSVKLIDGQTQSLEDHRGKPVLVVNVASKCGLTPQYAGLEKLYREFKDRGLVVLGLPCNQFGAQEPGNEAEIRKFCSLNYDVSFLLTAKIDVNGPGAHPLYNWLRGQAGGGDIQWNFEKFLIGKDGRFLKRYSPRTAPEDAALRDDIQAAL